MEDTFEHDISERSQLVRLIDLYSRKVAQRLVKAQFFARTITVKVRWPDFSLTSRSRTLNGATDQSERIAAVARDLLDGFDISGGVRLLGVGVSGFSDVAQEPLFELDEDATSEVVEETSVQSERRPFAWLPGMDVIHSLYGAGWVWGSGLGRITVRFETKDTGPGPIRTFFLDDEELKPFTPPIRSDD
jgi:DNA polymerase-4